ncbi:MAG TPA: cytochrome c3 family protein [Gemmatimonadales bacterium]|nr:cytochrome c3 family protein [Gemmatimonadales bacterium]
MIPPLLFTPAAAVPAAAAAFQDTVLGRLPAGVHPADTVLAERFAPAPIVQFIFQQPPWLMWTGVAIALVAAVAILWWLWPRLPAVWRWFRRWPGGAKAAFFGAIGLVFLVAAGLGYKGYDYMMNDSRFCTGCHIFVPSGQVVQVADTGDFTILASLRGKHDTINCHTCHTFHLFGEATKMVLWMSGVRYQHVTDGEAKVGPRHGAVPRETCENCHQQGAAQETWQAIAATAGHRVHLESDSAAGKLVQGAECLTCHAQTAHAFVPADSTCSQDGCHLTDEIEIRLGKMSESVGMHCLACHQFTREVPALAGLDSARGSMRPAQGQCLDCHEMQERLVGFDPARDPHSGQCGMCHNPHTQVEPKEALKTCTDAACHVTWRSNEFHTGAAHRRVAQECELCHSAHAAGVDASACESCHQEVRGRATGPRWERLRPRLPTPAFDTTKALQQSSLAPAPPEPRGKGDTPPEEPPPAVFVSGPAPAPADTFSHERHKALACVACHDVRSNRIVRFEQPRGCQVCHHEAPASSDCTRCHEPGELRAALDAHPVVRVKDRPPRERLVSFSHAAHTKERCVACHAAPVSLSVTSGVRACTDCHEQHHAVGSDCAACHRLEATRTAHEAANLPGAPPAAHRACSECHAEATVARLVPTRAFCLACHEADTDHYPPRECTECHFQASPEALRPSLGLRGASR